MIEIESEISRSSSDPIYMDDISKVRIKKLSLKYVFVLTILVFFISFFFTIYNIYYQKHILINEMHEKGKLLAEILAHNARIGVFSENKKLLNEINNEILHQEEVIEVSVFNPQGILLKRNKKRQTDNVTQYQSDDSTILKNVFDRLTQTSMPYFTETSDYIKFWSPVISNSVYFEAKPLFLEDCVIPQQDRIIGFVAVTLDKEILKIKLDILFLNCIAIGGISWILSFPFICLISKKITRPIRHLTENVRILGKGGTITHIPIETNDEIGELARSFNEMHESLKKRESEKYRLEQKLRQSQKLEAIGSLARGVAHEFNNILGIMMGYAELALAEVPKGVPLKTKLQKIIKAGTRAKDLMVYLSIFSKKNEKKMKPLQLSATIKESLNMLRTYIPTLIELREHIMAETATVMSNTAQIHQMVMNLCHNACEAMPEGGILDVYLDEIYLDSNLSAQMENIPEGPYAKLTVKDTGSGMTDEIAERIFDPFFTTKTSKEGAGMGLSIVHGIVKRYNGAISVETREGRGTVVQIFLPLINS